MQARQESAEFFTRHTAASAPKGSAEVLARVEERYGFVPHLAAYLAESPITLDAVLSLAGAFDKSSLTPPEQQLVLLAVSARNECDYCRTVHAGLARKAGVDPLSIRAVLGAGQIENARWQRLHDFTVALVERRGQVGRDVVESFLRAGYTKAQVFEVVMGVALKTLTNYSNHLAGAEPNDQFIATAEG